jgi:hypothetical protein
MTNLRLDGSLADKHYRSGHGGEAGRQIKSLITSHAKYAQDELSQEKKTMQFPALSEFFPSTDGWMWI